MLASTCSRLARPSLARFSIARHRQPPRRTLFSSTVQSLSDGFLDLATALPYPSSWPAYSSTIILVTVMTRLVYTVPFSIWAKKRQWRVEELVIPQLQQEAPKLSQVVFQEMKNAKVRGSEQEIRAFHGKRFSELMNLRRKQLHTKYKCSPLPTMLMPVVTQLPLFAGLTIVLGRLSQPPTPFDSESFLTLTSLAHTDPTATLPIALGLITLANVESSRWFISEEKRMQESITEKRNAEKRAKGQLVVEPSKIVQTSLRLLAVVRILVAAIVPGGVALYWVTSAVFGLFQSWVFDWWEARRVRSRRIKASNSPSAALRKPRRI